jgi:transposase
MFKPPSLSDLDTAADVGYYLCTRSTDMRKGFDALAELARQVHARDVFSGSLFIFISRRRDRLKILYWDKDGFALWYKRLEAGSYRLPVCSADGVSIKGSELAMLLDGVDLRSLKRTRRLAPCVAPAVPPAAGSSSGL